MKKYFIGLGLVVLALQLQAQPLQRTRPDKVGMDPAKFIYADQVIHQAIDKHEIPGAVLAVVRHGKMAYIKAYGNRQVYPDTLQMEESTVFDLASVSKSVSTAISTLVLIEQGKIRLQDNVSLYIPGFKPWTDAKGNTVNIKVVDLLTHTSGLPPYASVTELKAT
jgi:CubicO group peptidase (beta-lactamase class C family)